MFKHLGAVVSRHWALVILAWIAVAAAGRAIAPRWEEVAHDGDLAYLPAGMPSVEGDLLMRKAFPQVRSKSQIAVIVERSEEKLTPADFEWSDALTKRFEALQGELPIVDVWDRNSEVVGDKLTSHAGRSGQACVIVLQLSNEFMATDNVRVLKRVLRMLNKAKLKPTFPAGLQVGVSGSAAIGGDMLTSAAESIKNTERTTIVLVVAILLLVYRAPLLVVIPLATIGAALVVSTSMLALLTQLGHVEGFQWWHFKVFTTTKIFIVVILFGAGTDFCLFLISRFKEELDRGLPRPEAVAQAVGHVGEAILGSALTTICGLGMMFFADFGKFRNSGPAIALCLVIALLACLTLAPALLRAFGSAVFWPLQAQGSGGTRPAFGRFWDWASHGIVARPGLVMVVCLLALAPFAFAGRHVQITYDFLNELQPEQPSVRGTAMLRRHFSAGETAPITVLALHNSGQFDTRSGRKNIALLTKSLYQMPGIVSVRSIAEPLGNRPGFFQPLRKSGLKKLAAQKHKRTEETFLTQEPSLRGKVARFDLILSNDPFSPAAIGMLQRIDEKLMDVSANPESPWHDAHFALLGTTVGIRDLKAVTESDQALIQKLVVLAVLVVLIVILRRPLICAYLIFSVLLSYFVAIGATQLFFAWLYGPTYYGLDWKVPIFLFVILIAVGEDYNIYLVTRIFEEQRRRGALEGLREAVARTGGIITSCGVIMAGTFISMMTGTLRGMLELGFALSLGVMLDTCIVRPVLVPAFLAVLYRATGAADIARQSEHERPHLVAAPQAPADW